MKGWGGKRCDAPCRSWPGKAGCAWPGAAHAQHGDDDREGAGIGPRYKEVGGVQAQQLGQAPAQCDAGHGRELGGALCHAQNAPLVLPARGMRNLGHQHRWGGGPPHAPCRKRSARIVQTACVKARASWVTARPRSARTIMGLCPKRSPTLPQNVLVSATPSMGPTYTAMPANARTPGDASSDCRCTGQKGPLISMAPMEMSWITNSA